MRYWFHLVFLLLSINSLSQRTIKGTVVNTKGEPVAGSSIFIASTSKGTISSGNGSFELQDVPAGNHELVVSSIGYSTVVHSFKEAQLPLLLRVEMEVKATELENVILEPSVEEGWDKWGKIFIENFVGSTGNAARCRIKNEDKIRFRHFKKSGRLVAYCDEPVLLENKALGYLISYQLENFEINFKEHSLSYIGYPLFQPLEKGRQQKIDRNREEAYNGSVIHFMRALYANRLTEEGFEVRRMVRIPNYEKQRVKLLYRPAIAKAVIVKGPNTIFQAQPVTDSSALSDSAKYYERILRQDDFRDLLGSGLLTADSLIVETQPAYKVLHFDNYIHITYKNELEAQLYVDRQFPARKPGYQRSFVSLTNNKLIVLDETGNYYNPQEFITSAYWGWNEKMSNAVPLDYEPKK